MLNIWILWWNAQAVPLTERWWNPPMMWPMPGAMALSEHLLGLSVLATPLQLAGANPIAAYNVCLVLTYALSAFFAFLLVRHLTGSAIAALCAGIAFGFSPYRAGQLSHIQVLASQWMPLALLGMHAYLATGRRGWLAVFGAAWLLQAMSNGYYLLFFPVLIGLWLLWFVDWRREPGRGLALVGAWIVASLPLIPLLLKYYSVHKALGLRRTVPEIREFSAVPASFLHPAPLMRFWPEGPAANFELYLFPGLIVVILALAALALMLWRRQPAAFRASTVVFYAGATVLIAALTLGPGGVGDEPASLLKPFSWLLWLPGYDGIRVSARFAMIAVLCLAITAGFGMARLAQVAGRWRPLAAAIALAGLLADGATEPVPVLTPPGRIALPNATNPAVVELPLDNIYVSVAAMYRGIAHGQPVVNGYSGHFPPHYNVLSLSLARGDTSGLIFLARRRPQVIIVNDLLDPGHGYRKMIEGIPGIQSQGITAGGSTFLLPPQPAPKVPPAGAPLDIKTVTDAGRFLMDFDLGGVRDFGAIEFPLRNRYPDLASRLRIEVSDDGVTWREAWTGWTGGIALEATLADPRVAPVRLPLPAARGRYVRVYPASTWMKAELRVLGP